MFSFLRVFALRGPHDFISDGQFSLQRHYPNHSSCNGERVWKETKQNSVIEAFFLA